MSEPIGQLSNVVVSRCGCQGCNLPYASIQNGVVVVESKHHGDTHKNHIPLLTPPFLAEVVRQVVKEELVVFLKELEALDQLYRQAETLTE